jgi:hypothetical protein
MNSLQAIHQLATYLASKLDEDMNVKVFKARKVTDYTGDYIVVNSLPFTTAYGNQGHVLNVNVHCRALSTGEPDLLRIEQLQGWFESVVPAEIPDIEVQEDVLVLGGCEFFRYCDSNAMADADNTFYINNKVRLYNYYG